MRKGSSIVINSDSGDFWNFVSSLIGALIVFALALYKDNRTHKRIDATDQWIGKVEKYNMDAIRKVEIAQKEHTEMILRDYPTINGMNAALAPISEKIDGLKQDVTQVKMAIDNEQKEKIISLEKERSEQKREIERLKTQLGEH